MPAAPEILDPYSLVYDRLWTIATEFPGLVALRQNPQTSGFKSVIDFVRHAFPPGKALQSFTAGETPLFSLMQGRSRRNLAHFDGGAFRVVRDYVFVVASRDLNVVALNRINWQLDRAMFLAGPYLGLNPGPVVNPVDYFEGGDDPGGKNEWAKGDERWVSVSTCRVELLIPGEAMESGEFQAE